MEEKKREIDEHIEISILSTLFPPELNKGVTGVDGEGVGELASRVSFFLRIGVGVLEVISREKGGIVFFFIGRKEKKGGGGKRRKEKGGESRLEEGVRSFVRMFVSIDSFFVSDSKGVFYLFIYLLR